MLRVKLLDKVYEYEGKAADIENIALEVDELLKNPSYVFQGIIADGNIVLDDPYMYLQENIANVTEVEFVISTIDQLIMDTIDSMAEYIERAVPEIRVLVDDFYLGGENDENINKLGQLIEGILWIISALESFGQFKETSGLLGKDVDGTAELINQAANLKDGYSSLKDAMLSVDMISIADLLNYEILPVFELIGGRLGKIRQTA